MTATTRSETARSRRVTAWGRAMLVSPAWTSLSPFARIASTVRSVPTQSAPVRAATIGSVVPALTLTLAEACRRYLRVEAQSVSARTPLPIRLDVEEPLTVGADRIVNTLAAMRMFGVDTVVVDLGTATTFDCITREGVFIGGVISPGVMITRAPIRVQPHIFTAKPIGIRMQPCEAG